MQSTRLIALAGSTRGGSLNQQLVTEVARKVRGAGIQLLKLSDFPLPLYDGDLEGSEGIPPLARELAWHIDEADGLVIASPEYNASMSAVLKNTLDWVSRVGRVFQGKPVMLVSASPGALGGLQGLGHLRAVLTALGALVLPGQRALGRAHEAFDSEGRLLDPQLSAELEHLTAEWVKMSERLARADAVA